MSEAGTARARLSPRPGAAGRARARTAGWPASWPGWLQQLVLLAAYLTAGVAVTWPRAAFLADGRLPAVVDIDGYVWDLWWVAHQVVHLGNPWSTGLQAAPAGVQLGFDTSMPLAGLVLAPVTLLFGPSASFSLLTIAAPGLLCYVMYRAARLWLSAPGAIAAGALFGLSAMADWQVWFHLNIGLGTLFLPMTLEAAVRLRRSPGWRAAIVLGLVLGASVLVNQESAVSAVILAALVLLPWAAGQAAAWRGTPTRADTWRPAASLVIAGLTAVVIASPQLAAMIGQAASGGATVSSSGLTRTYLQYGAPLPTLFAPSPRLGSFALPSPGYGYQQPAEGVATFGLVLTALAVTGLVMGWRQRHARWLALLWLGSAALALGPVLYLGNPVSGPSGVSCTRHCAELVPLATSWHGVRLSALMPYTWLVRVPGLADLREADRLALAGLMGAAVLAGLAVDRLALSWPRPGRPAVDRPGRAGRPGVLVTAAVAVTLLAIAEAGWSGRGPGTMRTALPALDGPIAADHSGSVVVDVPWGLRGGIPLVGSSISPQALVLATADGHPRAISNTSWVPATTTRTMLSHAFYAGLDRAQHGQSSTAAQLSAARADLGGLHVGWVVLWRSVMSTHLGRAGSQAVVSYLSQLGFRPAYSADGATVLRPGG
ncbi:MAG TPA: hypothetical protein VGI64_23215 [Streptosporangiaceae bacterium]